MAAITYGKSVTAAEQYHGIINAEKFSSFGCKYFASMFKKSVNLRMGILCRTVWKPDPPGIRLVIKNLPFQQEV